MSTSSAADPAPPVDASGIGDGSGTKCLSHSYSTVDSDGASESRVESLSAVLKDEVGSEKLVEAICALGEATAHIALLLQNYVEHTFAGTQNTSGDEQLHLDIDCDNAVFAAVRSSGVFSVAASEETPTETAVGRPDDNAGADDVTFSLGFDPLDGSSIIDANFSVGSIYGIWPGKGLLGRRGREQVASAVALYGPRTTLCIALPGSSPKVLEVTLVKNRTKWELSRDSIQLKPAGKVFAPGNLRASNDNAKYAALINHWIEERYTLRYSGGMVPDVYHMFAKSKGVFSNVSSEKARAKLRLLYEVAPIGLIVECAGGMTTHEAHDGSVLDEVIDDLDRRLGVCFGSREEVEKYKRFMLK
eukprot:CAMPEP_0197435968 /NCGR_PEP_ID=MMETSP1175-20131217/3454_1 /TAXON_ID=1003142 /ORGANISM="Triceratium dubium, Strain CCMP147" /LENGTH=359 /DNA_ID=CAMNT_0042965123 /DNA_START=27 /DNA_END=1106 /DNA_ORIENTATION=-